MITIPVTDVRRKITELKDTERCKEISLISGIRRIEMRKHDDDDYNEYRCANYVFETVMKEAWGDVFYNGGIFWKNAAKFLLDHGYRIVESIENNDVVAYGINSYLKHFGLYHNTKVTSKFDIGCVFEHDIGLVPDTYGDEAYFFRKSA